jgi:hypothetical protein
MSSFGVRFSLLISALMVSVSARETPALTSGFVLVVHGSNAMPSISRSDLKRAITGGTKQWSNGAVIQLGLIPNDMPETQYLAALVDMSTRDLIGRIQEQVFKGEMRRPTVLRSSQDCLGLSRANPGAICVAAAGLPLPNESRVVGVR